MAAPALRDEEGGFGEEGEGFVDVFSGTFCGGDVGVGEGFCWGVGVDVVGDECDEGGFVVEAVEVGEEEAGGFGELDGFEAEVGDFFVGGGAEAGVGGGDGVGGEGGGEGGRGEGEFEEGGEVGV